MEVPVIEPSLYFGVFNDNNAMEAFYQEHREELKEAYYGVLINGDTSTPDDYQYSTRTTNKDNEVLAEYNKADDHREIQFIESVWGYVGWQWETYSYNSEQLTGGHFTNFKPTTTISKVDDGWRLQHLNNFATSIIRNLQKVEEFDRSNVKVANKSFYNSNAAYKLSLDTFPDDFFNSGWDSLESCNQTFYNVSDSDAHKRTEVTLKGTLVAPSLLTLTNLQQKTGLIEQFDIPNVERILSSIISMQGVSSKRETIDSVDYYKPLSVFLSPFNKATPLKDEWLIQINDNSYSDMQNLRDSIYYDLDSAFSTGVTDTLEVDVCSSSFVKINNLNVVCHTHEFNLYGVSGNNIIADTQTQQNINNIEFKGLKNSYQTDSLTVNRCDFREFNEITGGTDFNFSNITGLSFTIDKDNLDVEEKKLDAFSNALFADDYQFVNIDRMNVICLRWRTVTPQQYKFTISDTNTFVLYGTNNCTGFAPNSVLNMTYPVQGSYNNANFINGSEINFPSADNITMNITTHGQGGKTLIGSAPKLLSTPNIYYTYDCAAWSSSEEHNEYLLINGPATLKEIHIKSYQLNGADSKMHHGIQVTFSEECELEIIEIPTRLHSLSIPYNTVLTAEALMNAVTPSIETELGDTTYVKGGTGKDPFVTINKIVYDKLSAEQIQTISEHFEFTVIEDQLPS